MNSSKTRTLQVMHFAMILGQLLFAVVVYFLVKDQTAAGTEEGLLLYIVPFLAIAGMIIGAYFFRKKIASIPAETSPEKKFALYQGASLVRYSFLQGPSLFAIAVCLLTANLIFLLFSAVLILYLAFLRPSEAKVSEALGLTGEEVSAASGTRSTL